MNSISRQRVAGIDHAARIFAHRLAIKAFGRSGRMLALARVRRGSHWTTYSIRIGTRSGPATNAMLLVTER